MPWSPEEGQFVELLSRCRAREEQAWKELHGRLDPFLPALVSHFAGQFGVQDENRVAEACQDAWVLLADPHKDRLGAYFRMACGGARPGPASLLVFLGNLARNRLRDGVEAEAARKEREGAVSREEAQGQDLTEGQVVQAYAWLVRAAPASLKEALAHFGEPPGAPREEGPVPARVRKQRSRARQWGRDQLMRHGFPLPSEPPEATSTGREKPGEETVPEEEKK